MTWQKKEIKKEKIKKKRNKEKGIKSLFSLILLFIFIGAIFWGIFFLLAYNSLPNPNKLIEREISQSTKIYDRESKTVLYEVFGGERRTLVELSAISHYLIQATIVAEDRTFYENPGFSLKSMARAIITNILHGGTSLQGGSTITQQLVKNAILSSEKTIIRKVKELFLSYQIEKKFTKDEILKMYLNEIPYGSNAYGIEAASQIYFAKKSSELTLDEAALLAALPKAPTFYSPHGQNKKELIGRRDYILDEMFSLKEITKDEYDYAKKQDTLAKIKPKKERMIAPHFVMDVREYLIEKYGSRMVEEGGLKITTTIDLNLQKIAEEAIKNNEKNLKTFGANNAALVSLDTKTGEVLAEVGSKDYFDESIDGNVNVVTAPRQPGSSFKPIVYSEFFTKGFTPETILFDGVTNFGPDGTGKDYIPGDYDGKERGFIIARKALAGSLNIPAVEALYLSGVDDVLSLAEKMGYTTFADRSRFGLSIVLGGAEVKLIDHTSAFGIFAREGTKIPTVSILKVEDAQGNVLEAAFGEPRPFGREKQNVEPEQVLDPEITRKINSILSDNSARAFIFGEKNYLTLPDRPVAAKTGTTQNWHDAWTIGYTPSLVCGVWVGNTKGEIMNKKADGSVVAAPIWHEFMAKALANQPVENFTPPAPDIVDKPVLRGEIPGAVILKIDRASGKLATDMTPPSFIEEKKYQTAYHSILNEVDKNDPRGPIPSFPESDPMYARWEEAVSNWARKNHISFETPPQLGYDDLHILANQPNLILDQSLQNINFGVGLVSINGSANAPRGIRKIEGLIDNTLFDSAYSLPFNLAFNTTGFSNGSHQITIRACDDIDNCRVESANIYLNQSENSRIFFISPQNSQTLYPENFPLPISIALPPYQIKEMKFYYQRVGSSDKKLILTFPSPTSYRINVNWLDNPVVGQYELFLEAIDANGAIIPSDKIIVNVY